MYNRFFTFGCSFTSYYWPTWADIIGQEFGDNFYNLAMCGAGNEFMFHRLTEAHARYNITKDDLVIICWTNFAREDRYLKGKWRSAGNMSTQTVYPQDWVRKWFDLRGALLKTSSVIAGATHLLDVTGCEYMFTSMVPMKQLDQYNIIFADEDYQDIFSVYDQYYKKIHTTSMTDHLYGSGVCLNPAPIHMKLKNNKHPDMIDHHPSPSQHLKYATDIILPALKENIKINNSTIDWVTDWNDRIYKNQPYHMLGDGWTPEYRYNKWHKNMC
jgi:hypothetical protein